MATATAFHHVNMDTASSWGGEIKLATETQIQVADGGDVQNYYGNFTYNSFGLSGGTVNSTNYYEFGSKIYEINGDSYNAVTVKNYVLSNNMQGLFSYIFSANDTFNGSAEADILNGFSGNDLVHGNAGNDKLKGDIGNDTLIGGLNKDMLIGGSGADKFDFNYSSESGLTSTSRDVINDFKHVQNDKIDLHDLDAKAFVAGNQNFTFIDNQSFTSAGQVRFDAASHILSINTDADNNAELQVLLTGVSSLQAADLIL